MARKPHRAFHPFPCRAVHSHKGQWKGVHRGSLPGPSRGSGQGETRQSGALQRCRSKSEEEEKPWKSSEDSYGTGGRCYGCTGAVLGGEAFNGRWSVQNRAFIKPGLGRKKRKSQCWLGNPPFLQVRKALQLPREKYFKGNCRVFLLPYLQGKASTPSCLEAKDQGPHSTAWMPLSCADTARTNSM